MYLYELKKQAKNLAFHNLFLAVSQRVQINFIIYLTTMYIYCVYPVISKSPKQLTNCLKIAETSVILIVFNGVICDVSTHTVIISFSLST